jgi:hypothetical protein
MNWTRDLGDISKNVAFKDYYYIQLSCKNTGATKLEITEINLTTYDLAFDEFLSNCWVSNNIK